MKKNIIIIVVFVCMLIGSVVVNALLRNEINDLKQQFSQEKDTAFIEHSGSFNLEIDSAYIYKFKSDDELNWYFIQQFIETADSVELNFHASTNGSVNGDLIFKWNH